MPETERFEHAGCTIVIGLEEYDTEHANPRSCDGNVGTMVCWHPDYILGDEQISTSRGAVHRDRHGSASTMFQTENGRTDFGSMEQIERYLRLARGAVVVMPLYLLDHSGISMSVGAPSPFDNPRVHDAGKYGSLGWDTTMCGFIYATAESANQLTDTSRENVAKVLREEVHYYDAYLQGSVYYYVVEDAEGEHVDSCGGFLVADYDELETYVKAEAKASAEDHAKQLALDAEPDTESAIYEASR